MFDYGKDKSTFRNVIIEERVRSERVFSRGKTLSPVDKLMILYQYLKFLEALKQKGIINLDPKMDNVFYDADEVEITAIDLGVVKFATNRADADRLMKEGLFRPLRGRGVPILAEEVTKLFDGQGAFVTNYAELAKSGSLPDVTSIPKGLQRGMIELFNGRINSIPQLEQVFRAG